MDLRQTDEYAHYLEIIGWRALRVSHPDSPWAYIRQIPLTPFSIMKVQRYSHVILESQINRIVKRHRVVRIYLEPNSIDLVDDISRYSLKSSTLLPSKTLVIDLSLSDQQLKRQMKPKTRYNLNLTNRKKLLTQIITGHKLLNNKLLSDTVWKLLNENSARIGIFRLPKKWYKAQLSSFGEKTFYVIVRDKSKQILSVTAHLTSADTVFYSHNGSTLHGRKVFAPTLAVWEGIKEGKRRGLDYFDFDGIYDTRFPLKRWKGFTRFKQNFGGNQIEFPGTFAKTFWPF